MGRYPAYEDWLKDARDRGYKPGVNSVSPGQLFERRALEGTRFAYKIFIGNNDTDRERVLALVSALGYKCLSGVNRSFTAIYMLGMFEDPKSFIVWRGGNYLESDKRDFNNRRDFQTISLADLMKAVARKENEKYGRVRNSGGAVNRAYKSEEKNISKSKNMGDEYQWMGLVGQGHGPTGLSYPRTFEGEAYRERVQENKDLIDRVVRLSGHMEESEEIDFSKLHKKEEIVVSPEVKDTSVTEIRIDVAQKEQTININL